MHFGIVFSWVLVNIGECHLTDAFSEPDKLVYFGDCGIGNLTVSEGLIRPIRSINAKTAGLRFDDFSKFVRSGLPVVFTDAAADWKDLLSMSCSDYAAKWPDSNMRAEYQPAGQSNQQTLGNQDWIHKARTPALVVDDTARAAGEKPTTSPYVWHVKDGVKESIKADIQEIFPGLHWLRDHKLLSAHMNDTMEFWFQKGGGGTFAHNDAYCHSVFSVQLRGRKRWRFMMLPKMSNLSRDVFDEFDSGIYHSSHQWSPDFEVTLEPGHGVLFAPGFMHETVTIEGDDEDCATSVTFLIPVPLPTRYIRNYLPRLSLSREVHHCMSRWESFATLDAAPTNWSQPFGGLQAKAMAVELMATLDVNGDSLVSSDEVENFLLSSNDPRAIGLRDPRRSRKRFSSDIHFAFGTFKGHNPKMATDEMVREGMIERAIDTVNFWDINADGVASVDEMESAINRFHFNKWRQELVDFAVNDFEIGSIGFKKRLEIVDGIIEKAFTKYSSSSTTTTTSSLSSSGRKAEL